MFPENISTSIDIYSQLFTGTGAIRMAHRQQSNNERYRYNRPILTTTRRNKAWNISTVNIPIISFIFHDVYSWINIKTYDACRLLRGFQIVKKSYRPPSWLLYPRRVWYAHQVVFYFCLCQSKCRYRKHNSTIGHLVQNNILCYNVCIRNWNDIHLAGCNPPNSIGLGNISDCCSI